MQKPDADTCWDGGEHGVDPADGRLVLGGLGTSALVICARCGCSWIEYATDDGTMRQEHFTVPTMFDEMEESNG